MEIYKITLKPQINNIAFGGIKRKPQEEINAANLTSNPLNSALPMGDKSLVVKPMLPSEYLNDADIARYKEVQKEWAQNFSKRHGIPFKNIMARLPEIVLGDANEMVQKGHLADFEYRKNIIEIIPIRELACLHGGDEGRIIHESGHGYLCNLGRASAKKIPLEQVSDKVTRIVVTRILQGENAPIIKGWKQKNISDEENRVPHMMRSPLLSKKERSAFINTLSFLRREFLNDDASLNDAGKIFVKITLLPKLNEYTKSFNKSPETLDDKACEKIFDYIQSFFTRKNLLFSCLTSPKNVDLKENLKTPLTEKENELARDYTNGLLQTLEGNFVVNRDNGFLKQSKELYFMSYDEVFARKEQSYYRLRKINKKIRDIKATGMQPAENVLKEQKTVKSNIKLLNLMEEFRGLQQQIVSAPKDQQKLNEIINVSKEASNISEELKTEKEALKRNSEFAKKIKLYFKKLSQYNELNMPDRLLVDTVENNELKIKYYGVLSKIRKIAVDCDLTSIPRLFFASELDSIRATRKSGDIMAKWVKILKKV